MSEQEVIDLMKSSKSEQEWNANADIVRSKYDGYPDFWFMAIIASGIASEVLSGFGIDIKIRITKW